MSLMSLIGGHPAIVSFYSSFLHLFEGKGAPEMKI